MAEITPEAEKLLKPEIIKEQINLTKIVTEETDLYNKKLKELVRLEDFTRIAMATSGKQFKESSEQKKIARARILLLSDQYKKLNDNIFSTTQKQKS